MPPTGLPFWSPYGDWGGARCSGAEETGPYNRIFWGAPTYLYLALAYASGGSGSQYLLRASASRSRKPGSIWWITLWIFPGPGTAATGYGMEKEGLDEVMPLPLLLLGQKQLDHRLRLVDKLLLYRRRQGILLLLYLLPLSL